MCVSCGCGKPNDAHGDMRNITRDDVNRAAEAAGITADEAVRNIAEACQGGSRQDIQGQGNVGKRSTGRRGYETESDLDRS